ncbi:hypothetical protein [Bradyrhizobium roseum]|uniref:hypothetical protein n=1 Tax=Bradyrhizobium roseum TaxID=3056648 RepID=UPI0026343505|nr:hypothetical protein [Bradyrhizobium roseus]WKA31839.1 hypothetical protein QUH67_17485 [Bradyrhizobium roseus]
MVERPCFVINQIDRALFQDVFVRPGKWFRPGVVRKLNDDNFAAGAHASATPAE